MSEREGRGKPERPISAEAVGTLVWLLDSSLDRRRYAVVNRLRAVRDSDEFGSLPEALRERVRKLIAESEQEWS
jgi:hypothetical protein